MISYSYLQFFLCNIALFAAFASAYAPSNDTPTDEQVSCVHPISGQYGLLPRILFYASLLFAIFAQHFEWLVIGALASAMTFSATSAIHIIIIFAKHGRNPPILDLDVLGIAMIALTSVSLYPALVLFSPTLDKNPAGAAVVNFWLFTMIVTGILASIILYDTGGPPLNSNAEVACLLPDKTLLTSLAQLNGTRNLECIYDCFLTRGSALKPQDAATVTFWVLVGGRFGNLILAFSSCAVLTGFIILFMSSKKSLAEGYKAARERVQMRIRYWYSPGSDKDVYAILVLLVLLETGTWMMSIIISEVSIRNIPVEEGINAVGQWGPWVAATFAIIGSLIYRAFEHVDSKGHKEPPSTAPNEIITDPPTDDIPSGEGTQNSYSMDNLSRGRRTDYTPAADKDPASRESVDSYTQSPQRHHREDETAYNRQTPAGVNRGTLSRSSILYANHRGRLYAVRGRSPERNSVPYFYDEEADIGNYGTRIVHRGSSTSMEERLLPSRHYSL